MSISVQRLKLLSNKTDSFIRIKLLINAFIILNNDLKEMVSFFLSIGKWIIQVRSFYNCYDNLIIRHGEHREPDLILQIIPNNEPKEFPAEVQKFTKDGGLTKGLFFLDSSGRKNITLYLEKKNLFCNIGYLELMLLRAFYTLSWQNDDKSILIHSCAVAKDGYAYIFTGKSGSGKTTLANLSITKGTILHDEFVIIRKDNNKLLVQGTPFHTKLPVNTELSAPLKAVFFLRHGKELKIDNLNHAQAFIELMKQVVPPEGFDLSEFHISYERMNDVMDIYSSLVKDIPCFSMEFLPNSDFWHIIERI